MAGGSLPGDRRHTGRVAGPRVLFISAGQEDYLADSLFHGLRSLLGDQVVDFPKLDFAYESFPRERPLYGRGFTLYRLLPELDIDRNRIFTRAVAGEFDLVVFSSIWETFGLYTQLGPRLPTAQSIALVDGADRVEPYPYAGYWWRKPQWWFLPRAINRGIYFKRELNPWTGWFRSYLTLPPELANRLPSMRRIRPISFSIPESLVVDASPVNKDRLLASHVVDPEVAARLGVGTSYAFDDQHHYYADLQRSRFGVTTKKAGWDCLRHYEQAANGCVPCFRDLDAKPASSAPHGLNPGNCVIYRSADELFRRIETMTDAEYARLREASIAWARANTTRARARAFLRECGLGLAAGPDHPGEPTIAVGSVTPA